MEGGREEKESNVEKKQKILLATHFLNVPAGTQTWTHTLAMALQRRGHDVVLLTRRKGHVSELLEQSGLPVYKASPDLHFEEPFDFTICNHRTMLRWCRERKDVTGPIACFIHGVLPEKEQPISGADLYIAISEEVQEHIIALGFKVAAVLSNFVDLERFRNPGLPNEKIRKVFYLSNFQKVSAMIKRVCDRRGIEFVSSADSPLPCLLKSSYGKQMLFSLLGEGSMRQWRRAGFLLLEIIPESLKDR